MRVLWSILVGVAVLVMACAGKPTPKDDTMQNKEAEPIPLQLMATGFSPRWHEGDAWELRYRVRVASPAKSASPSPRYEEHDWRYSVDVLDKDGSAHVSAHLLDEDADVWRMIFASTGALIELDTPRTSVLSSQPIPFVPLSPGVAWNLTPAWPGFPVKPESLSFEGGALTQQVTTDGINWTVTMVRRGEDGGMGRERTVVQQWEADRPWWSSVRIDGRTTYDGQTYQVLELEGRVTNWTLAQKGDADP